MPTEHLFKTHKDLIPGIEIKEPDWKMAFGALTAAVIEAQQSGDFSKCTEIIQQVYTPFIYISKKESE
jgi:hypothetical protein